MDLIVSAVTEQPSSGHGGLSNRMTLAAWIHVASEKKDSANEITAGPECALLGDAWGGGGGGGGGEF